MDLAAVVLPVVGARAAGPAGLQFGGPWQMDAGGIVGIGSALLLPLLLWRLARAFRSERWSFGERWALTGFVLLHLLFVIQLGYWNLLGIRH
jgi:hypothetical protein